MKIVQIIPSDPRSCGIGLFGLNFGRELERQGFALSNVKTPDQARGADLVIVQHHSNLFAPNELAQWISDCPTPVILFKHCGKDATLMDLSDAVLTMTPGLLRDTSTPSFIFRHPAHIASNTCDRTDLRYKRGISESDFVVSTHGFLKFERRLFDIAERLLVAFESQPEVKLRLFSSPWRYESPGLLDKSAALERRFPRSYSHVHAFLDEVCLQKELRVADLLWCWVDAPSVPYASGVVSDQYASGTRMMVANKIQHDHVLGLTNVVRGPENLEDFTKRLIEEVRARPRQRHDPRAVQWSRCCKGLDSFLLSVALNRG